VQIVQHQIRVSQSFRQRLCDRASICRTLFIVVAQVIHSSQLLLLHELSQLLIVDGHHLDLSFVLGHLIESQQDGLSVHVDQRPAFDRKDLIVSEEAAHIRYATFSLGLVYSYFNHFLGALVLLIKA